MTGTETAIARPRLSRTTMFDMAVANFGTATAFALQQGNMARIFQSLGADLDALPILMIAGPVTGLVVQPLVGHFSDRTWCRLGRRRPYFLAGAVLSALALLGMAWAATLAVAVACYWLLDAALNVAIEPFRAFVGDLAAEDQRTWALAINGAMGCIGAVIGFLLPFVLARLLGPEVAGATGAGGVPVSVRLALALSALVLVCGVGWTAWRVREYPPAARSSPAGASEAMLPSLWRNLTAMPPALRKLAVIQMLTWFALYIMWPFMTPVITRTAFHASDPHSPAYNAGADWVGVLYAGFNVAAAGFGMIGLPRLAARLGKARAHALCLGIGALSFAALFAVDDPWLLFGPFAGLGMAWASLLTLPYVMLTDALDGRQLGAYTGIFNVFVVLPQIVVATVMGPVLRAWFPDDPVWTMAFAGVAMAAATVLTLVLQPDRDRAVRP